MRGVLGFVFHHLVAHGSVNVDRQFVGDRHGVTDNVSQLVTYLLELLWIVTDFARCFRADPLEMLHQFGRFDGQGH